MERIHDEIGMPDGNNPQFDYETVSEEKLCQVAETLFTFYLLDEGAIHGATAQQMALRFYSPVFFLLQKYDIRHIELAQAKEELRLMVTDFCRTYGGHE